MVILISMRYKQLLGALHPNNNAGSPPEARAGAKPPMPLPQPSGHPIRQSPRCLQTQLLQLLLLLLPYPVRALVQECGMHTERKRSGHSAMRIVTMRFVSVGVPANPPFEGGRNGLHRLMVVRPVPGPALVNGRSQRMSLLYNPSPVALPCSFTSSCFCACPCASS